MGEVERGRGGTKTKSVRVRRRLIKRMQMRRLIRGDELQKGKDEEEGNGQEEGEREG